MILVFLRDLLEYRGAYCKTKSGYSQYPASRVHARVHARVGDGVARRAGETQTWRGGRSQDGRVGFASLSLSRDSPTAYNSIVVPTVEVTP